MKIGGFLKISLIDYREKISSVVFTKGCPFRCPYCHNRDLVLENPKNKVLESQIFNFLKERKGKIDGVVISGGEPTIQEDLLEFIKKIKTLGFLVKLDTSGINPNVLEELLKNNLLDYIAMDIKNSFEKYKKTIKVPIDMKKIKESINLILNSPIDYEFRTTLVDGLHDEEDILKMAKKIKGAKLYVLQEFIPNNTLNPEFQKNKPLSPRILKKIKPKIEKYVKECVIY
jgi:pyruvate formate lyase activating enzyme